MMNSQLSPTPQESSRFNYMRRDRFEVNQYVRVQMSDTRFAIGVVTAIDDDHDKATVETRNGYEVTLPFSALRRAFLVVLDLNGVLVARGRGSFILRPHVMEFLKFVFSNFVVAVWTSGLQRSSNPIIEHVFGSYRDLLLFTLFRDSCVPKATPENPYGTEKNLQTIFDRYPLSFHAVNTIIIDDSPDKCSHPDIALCPVPFKDPVAQSQDDGLLATIETLRQVLQLDSGVPLILAAEERLHRLAEEQEQQQQKKEVSAPSSTAATASASPVTDAAGMPASAPVRSSPEEFEVPADMEEVELWKTRLCCENLQGKCTRGEKCPFSHEPDDGRPCSRKSNCRHHGSRWPKTSEEAEHEARKRQIREAKQQQYRMELEKRQLEEQQQQYNTSRKGQPRRQSDLLQQLQQLQQQQKSVASSSSHVSQRQRGGRRRHDRRQQQQQQRGGRQDDEEWRKEEEDWASGPTGLSHTGDPTYDNMINEQQMQQQRRNAVGATGRASMAQGSYTVSASRGQNDVNASSSSPHTVAGGYDDDTYTNLNSNSNSNHHISSGYRRQLQHHSQSNITSSGIASGQSGQSTYVQPQQGPTAVRAAESVPLFFQSFPSTTTNIMNSSLMTTATTTTIIQPFSTRPIAPSSTSAQPSMLSVTASLAAASAPQSRSFATGGSYADPQLLQQRYTSLSSAPQPQAIRISGRQGDSNAVVNQLQALMRKS
jgi:hypothetical protein